MPPPSPPKRRSRVRTSPRRCAPRASPPSRLRIRHGKRMALSVVHLLSSLLRNVRGGFRIALFLPVERSQFRVRPADFAALAIFDLLVWIAGSALRMGPDTYFNYAALPSLVM